MNIKINKDKCLTCGMCISTYDNVFEWADDGSVKVKDNVDLAFVKENKDEILDVCPAEAIEITEN